MHYSRTFQRPVPPKTLRPVSELIVEAYNNGHPVWQIAAQAGVPRSHVMAVLVRTGTINALDTGEQEPRAIRHVPAPAKADG